MGYGITSKEWRTRGGYILLGFFSFYLVEPLREWAELNLPVLSQNPILVGVIGIVATLYLFDFG